MSESKPSFWHNAWNEPRRFFAWLALFSLVGAVIGYVIFASTDVTTQPSNPWIGKLLIYATAICLALFLLSISCFVLAWIPPLRRLMTWLLQRRFYALACLATLVALFYAEENWRGKRAWDNYRQEWEAKGERFDFASIVPPPVPAEQNFALTPIVYSSYGTMLDKQGHRKNPPDTNIVDRLAMSIYREGDYGNPNLNLGSWQEGQVVDLKPWQDYYRNPKPGLSEQKDISTNDFPASLQPQTPAADVLLALSKYDSAIEELSEAAKLPASRFPVDYDNEMPFDILLPHLAKIKAIAQVLNLRALAELEAGRPDKAFADLKLGFRCKESVANEPFLISHLVRIAVQSIMMQSVWQGLAEHKWSESQIAELEAGFAKLDYLADFRKSILGERAGSIAIIELFRRKRSANVWLELSGLTENTQLDKSPQQMLGTIGWCLAPEGSFYQTELAFVQMHQRWTLPLVDLTNRVVSPAINARLSSEFEESFVWRPLSVKNTLVRLMFPALGKAAKKFAIIQAQVDLARIGCALERHRIAYGNYPVSLAALAPKFLAKLPHDVITGEPLHYRREGDGYVLYSIGWNEKDDGGTVSVNKSGRADTDEGDWVWRVPVK